MPAGAINPNGRDRAQISAILAETTLTQLIRTEPEPTPAPTQRGGQRPRPRRRILLDPAVPAAHRPVPSAGDDGGSVRTHQLTRVADVPTSTPR
jgi:hypothetical protein